MAKDNMMVVDIARSASESRDRDQRRSRVYATRSRRKCFVVNSHPVVRYRRIEVVGLIMPSSWFGGGDRGAARISC